jgi:TolB-like protein/Flp pilus assembly protein TadD
MKRCPQCHRIERDNALKFCRIDGATLIAYDSNATTAIFGSVAPTIPSTARQKTRRRRAASKSIDSIAVLPFENGGADPNTEYLSDGLTENIINNLSQLPRLKVMARSTVFRFKDQPVDPQRVAADLGVRAIATGRVQQLADRLTIAVELVDGEDGAQLWGERYERRMSDIFELQKEISEQISTRLKRKLTATQKRGFAKRPTKQSAAYELYLRGRYFWNKRTEHDAHKGLECFQQALALDQNFALAYAGAADCQTLLGDVGVQAMPPKEAFLQGQTSATRALEIDSALAEAHGTLGHIKMHLFEWERAGNELRTGLELNPNYAQGWLWYAYYLAFTGKREDPVETIQRAQELDPLSLPVNSSAGELLHFAGRLDESIAQFHKAIDLDPDKPIPHLELGRAYETAQDFKNAIAQLTIAKELARDSPESLASLAHCLAIAGESAEAREILSELERTSATRYVSAYDVALVHNGLGQIDEAFRWLNRAYEIHDGWMIYLTVDPRWQTRYDDARFRDLTHRVGLPISA